MRGVNICFVSSAAFTKTCSPVIASDAANSAISSWYIESPDGSAPARDENSSTARLRYKPLLSKLTPLSTDTSGLIISFFADSSSFSKRVYVSGSKSRNLERFGSMSSTGFHKSGFTGFPYPERLPNMNNMAKPIISKMVIIPCLIFADILLSWDEPCTCDHSDICGLRRGI